MNQRGDLGQILLGFSNKDKRIWFYTKFHGKLFSILSVLWKGFKLESDAIWFMILKDHLAVVMSGLYREVVEVGIPVTKLQLN